MSCAEPNALILSFAVSQCSARKTRVFIAQSKDLLELNLAHSYKPMLTVFNYYGTSFKNIPLTMLDSFFYIAA